MMDLSRYEQLIPNIFLFNERRSFPDWRIGKRLIDFHDLTFIIEGRAFYYVNGVKHCVEAGDLIYIPPGSMREAYTVHDNPIVAYPFNFHWHTPHNEVPLPFDIVSKQMITKEIMDLILEFKHVWINQQPLFRIQARAILEQIIHRLLIHHHRLAHSHRDIRVQKALSYVAEHYDKPLHVADLAEQLQLHPVYFGKLFKDDTGQSFKEYVNRIRINHAEMLLASGDCTVADVAEQCGFADVAYFSNVFKLLKGYPPSKVKWIR